MYVCNKLITTYLQSRSKIFPRLRNQNPLYCQIRTQFRYAKDFPGILSQVLRKDSPENGHKIEQQRWRAGM